MKIRTTLSFNNSIELAQGIFGDEGNNATQIVKRALRAHRSHEFEYTEPEDKTVGNPKNFNIEIRQDAKTIRH